LTNSLMGDPISRIEMGFYGFQAPVK